MKKIAILLGTRPEIIKLSSIIRILQNQDLIEWFVIHTNQHYSNNMDNIFFSELNLMHPKYNLGINGGTHGQMTGKMIIAIEEILLNEKPDIIIIQGDTNSVISGGLAACKLGVKVAHVEAGLRSYDRNMPEEINRVIVDHISDFCFAVGNKQFNILKGEGIEENKIYTVGNTIVDAVYECLKMHKYKEKNIMEKYNIEKGGYFLLTSHRPSNVDQKSSLLSLIEGINYLVEISGKKMIFLVHPRTRNNLLKFGLLNLCNNIVLLEPCGFIENLILENNSYMIITDSGGIQEESCILQKKCLILRDNTERPETLEVGGALLVGNTKENIITGFRELINKKISWYNPFGDGYSSNKILDIITK